MRLHFLISIGNKKSWLGSRFIFLKTPTVVKYFLFQLLVMVDLPHFNILLLVGAQYDSVDLIRKKITVCLVTCKANNFCMFVRVYIA